MVFDEELVSRFEWLRHLDHDALSTPQLYMAFDLLRLEAKDYRPQPLKVRRKALEKLVKNQKLILAARRLSPNGICCVDRGCSSRMGRDGRETPGITLRGRAFPEVAQGEGAEVPRGRAGLGAEEVDKS